MSGLTAKRPQLLWHSNSPWAPTGYGQQTALFAPRLKEHYDLAISAYYGLDANCLPWNGIPVLPGIESHHGDETCPAHANAFFDGLRGGTVLTLMDVWVLDPKVWAKMNVASWCPVDHDPAPPKVVDFFGQSGAVPIAMSRFGQERLLDALYVPHAVDTKVYKPIPRKEARKRTKLPRDAFIVGMVAANKGNPSRKCFPQALQAFKAFRERHDDAILYLHTEMMGRFRGVNLPRLITELDLADSVIFTDQYRCLFLPPPPELMAAMYSSLDVLLNVSAGEGFGIPILEAQACGTPAIVTDFSAMPEVCGAGWKVDYRKIWVGMDQLAGPSWVADPDIEDTTNALNEAYQLSRAARRTLSEKAREHAEGYEVEKVLTEHMLPALAQARERFEDRAPKVFKPKPKVAA